MKKLLTVVALVIPTFTSCAGPGQNPNWKDWAKIDMRWPEHVLESRQAWDDATGRTLQYENGANQFGW